ncbi:cytidylyl-2-hydroxypropylphosphonate hydrolase [Streptomyces sp. NPDC002324]
MGDDGVVRRVEAGGSAAFWEPGSQILWRYRENGGERFHIARPVTVVRDDAESLAVWLAPGTECVRPVLADGTSLNSEPLASRYKKPRGVRHGRWSGTGVLKLARPGEPWSVWLFWEQGWRFKNWYVNLETPLARWDGGVDSEDHFLDICVYPDRSWAWLDEDEFAQAQQDGLMDASAAERVREAGRSAVEVIRAWGQPFADGWQHWRPNPAWGVPSLPDDWDRTPAHLSS